MPSTVARSLGRCKVASFTRTANLGQQKVHFKTDEAPACGMDFQVADVEMPLVVVSQLAAAGSRVMLRAKGGQIINIKTGRKMSLQHRGYAHVLRMVDQDFLRRES